MPRPVKEWIAKHDGANIPPRVRLRVFDAHGGICHICKLPIKPAETWQADHLVALVNGGEHRESNLAPVHGHCHVAKTARDVAEKAKVAAKRRKHIGIVDAPKMQGRPFPKTSKSARRDASSASKLPIPPPRPLFAPSREERP